MHISSTLSFEQIRSLPTIIEWLDTYNYFIKLFPSQKEEMIQIGVLCYSNVFMYHEDLKAEMLAPLNGYHKILIMFLYLTFKDDFCFRRTIKS